MMNVQASDSSSVFSNYGFLANASAFIFLVMFHSLDEQIENTVSGRPKTMEHLARIAGIVVVSVVVFGDLCLLIVPLKDDCSCG